ncbi:MAG: SCO family protein, partial [Gammaproteobacteria bacterium]|nr:SCO family protein [Gammaproteobacteria bacterium]
MTAQKAKPKIALTVTILLGVIALVFGGWVYKLEHRQPVLDELNATVLTHPRLLRPFHLVDEHNGAFTNKSLKGHWSILYFGYTHCPDICPTTLALLNQVILKIKQAKQPVPQVVFVSVDPQRDKPKALGTYVHYFNPEFVGVTGKETALKAL